MVTTDRRQFSTLAALAGVTSAAHRELLAEFVDPPSTIGMEQVRVACTLVNELRQADAAVGANELCDVAVQVHSRLLSWAANARYSREVGDALQSALADLAVEAAWLAIDSERRATARPYLNEAITRARIADDPQVEVRALTHLALLMREAQPIESLHCAEAALRTSAGWATPRLRSLLHLRRAHTFAVLNDASGYERAMAKARHELDRGPHDDDQGFVHFVNNQEVQGIRGLSYLCLGQPGRAADAFRVVTTDPSPAHRRNQLLYSVHLIDATRQQGDVNQAARMALDALPAVSMLRSQRVARHLAGVRANLGRLERPTAAVQQFTRAYDQQVTR
ncbi:hypothetical protein [Micromonospora palythoicola]|uniref:hypothetical protein n=1 Tax=Micromonospora palythoicola TaxID=3120507 RepID=UPI002FCE4238